MKKMVSIFILSALSALLLSACGGGTQMASAAGPEPLAIGLSAQNVSAPYTTDTPISDVMNDPVFGSYGRLIFPANTGYYSGDTLGDLRLTWYSHIDPAKTVEIVNTMYLHAKAGDTIFLKFAESRGIKALSDLSTNDFLPLFIRPRIRDASVVSGINTTGRRKGSHSLRSSLATALVEEGNDYTTVQKVLGHHDIRSTKAYIKVSVEQLRPYAMAVPAPSGYFKKVLKEGHDASVYF